MEGAEVVCRVRVGGELRSRKGLNLPGIDLGISAFTPHDRRCLEFALQHGVDAVSQSFVDRAADIDAVRAAAAEMGYQPFIIAKIERSGALERIHEILAAADGIMVARGDLGVEIPIEEMAIAQKRLMQLANRACKPVITATQMLESMIGNRLPTRAEATDVANAILDGTDCVMLSGESAVGQFPAEAVEMLGRNRSRDRDPPRPLRPGARRRDPLRATRRDQPGGARRRQRRDDHPPHHPGDRHRPHAQRRDGPQHRPLPAAGLGHGRELAGEDLPGPAVLVRRLSGLRAGAPGQLAHVGPELARITRGCRAATSC